LKTQGLFRQLLLAIWFITLVFIFTGQARSYEFTADFQAGVTWKSFPVKMKRFFVEEMDRAMLDPLISEAEYEWENSIGADIWDTDYMADSSVKNQIRWSNNFAAETGYDPYNTLAVTIRYQVNGILDRVEIILNGNILYLRENGNNILKTTLLHELGHTIGLDHSQAPAVMQAYLGEYEELQSDDVDGGIAVYDTATGRQKSGYLEELSAKYNEQDDSVSCATVGDAGRSAGGSNGSNGLGAVISLLLGASLMAFFRLKINN